MLSAVVAGVAAWMLIGGNPSASGATFPAPARTRMIYVGTYTQGSEAGIYRFRFNEDTGQLTLLGVDQSGPNPSFLALHPSGTFLYAVNEAGLPGPYGMVSAFRVDAATGALTLINRQSSQGTYPCHLVVGRAGRHVLAANYGSGSFVVLPVLPNGELGPASCVVQRRGSGPNPSRQEGPHAHSIYLDAAQRFALGADLGTDRVVVYRFDGGEGRLLPHSEATVAPGSGPRHLAFSKDERFVYVLNEMASTIAAFKYDAREGTLAHLQTVSALPPDFHGANTAAEVEVHPGGRFLYASNRGHDSIAVFRIDTDSGKLVPIGWQSTQGKTPRGFAVDPTGKWLIAANQDTDNLVVFHIRKEDGRLEPAGPPVKVVRPVCVLFAR
ncbi:MAG: lactonase family protein [Chthonomonadales bacterium]